MIILQNSRAAPRKSGGLRFERAAVRPLAALRDRFACRREGLGAVPSGVDANLSKSWVRGGNRRRSATSSFVIA